VSFVRTDHIGRPVFATNKNGTKVWAARYLPFGQVQTSGGDNIGLRFPGQWFNSMSGFHQNWMRDYDSTLGRYIQADPLGLVDGAAIYSYALQNPSRYIDPTGEFIPLAALGYALAGAAIGLAIGETADYLEENSCTCQPVFNPPTLLDAAAGSLIADSIGKGVPKPFRTPGSSKGSSLLSSGLSKVFPQRLPFRIPTPSLFPPRIPKTNVAGRAAGRLIPYAGAGLIGYDAYRIYRCIQ